VLWFFASRDQNTILQTGYLIQITVSSCIMSYLLAVPFYILVERPFKNFLDLILFPKSSIFKKHKDIDDGDDSSDEDDDDLTAEEKKGIKENDDLPPVHCGYCQNDIECDCYCLIQEKKCKCSAQRKYTESIKFSKNERANFVQQLKRENEKLKQEIVITEEDDKP
jgi:hypothetical protein